MLPFLNPRSPISMLSLYHGILLKVVSALFTTLNWGGGGGDKVCFVNVQLLCYISWNGLKGFVQDCLNVGFLHAYQLFESYG